MSFYRMLLFLNLKGRLKIAGETVLAALGAAGAGSWVGVGLVPAGKAAVPTRAGVCCPGLPFIWSQEAGAGAGQDVP